VPTDLHRDRQRSVALLAVATLTVMATVIIAPAIPDMAAAFRGAPHAELYTKLILTMPALTIVLFAPVAGWIVDRFGRLPFLYASMALYGAAGMAGFVLDDLGHILASRAVLGLAIGGTMTTMTALAGDYFAGEARTRFAALQSIVMSMGAVVCVGLGGVLAERDWRWPFLLYGTGWLVLPLVLAWLDEPPRGPRAAPVGAIADAPSLAPLLARIALVYVASFFAVAMFYVSVVQTPFLAREAGVASTALVGLALALSSLAAAIASSRYALLRRRFDFGRIYALAFAAMALGYALIAAAPSYPMILVGMAISGVGVGLFFPNGTVWTVALAHASMRGRVSGGLTASIFLGQFMSPILLQPVVAATSLAGAFGAAAALLAAASAAFLVYRPRALPGAPAATDNDGSHALRR
jgi:MFS family permease